MGATAGPFLLSSARRSERLLHRLDDAFGLGDLGIRRGEHLVDKLDLARMDGPFALEAEHGRALGRGEIAVGIGEIAERPVDRAQSIGAAGDHHARQGCTKFIRERQVSQLASAKLISGSSGSEDVSAGSVR